MNSPTTYIATALCTVLLLLTAQHGRAENCDATVYGNRVETTGRKLETDAASDPVKADSLIAFATQYIGTPYGYGGTTERYFDCSGFTGFVFNRFGIAIPRTSRDQYTSGESVSEGEWMPGDLVFFGGRAQSSAVNHVGIVVGTLDNGSFDFIHASTSKGVIISNSNEKYYAARYIGARRIFEPIQTRDVWEVLTERFSINVERGEELHAIDGLIKPFQPSSKKEIKRLAKLKRRYSPKR